MPDPNTSPSPSPQETAGSLDVTLSFLDRQVLDRDDTPVGKVDDIQLSVRGDGRLVLEAILLGPDALTPRFDEPLGRWSHAIWARLRKPGTSHVARVGMEHVTALDSAAHLDLSAAQIGNDGLERWVRTHVIGKIPGAGHDPGH